MQDKLTANSANNNYIADVIVLSKNMDQYTTHSTIRLSMFQINGFWNSLTKIINTFSLHLKRVIATDTELLDTNDGSCTSLLSGHKH